MGPVVTYGGTKIEAAKQREDNKTAVYLSPSDEKLKIFLDVKTRTCMTEVQRVAGMAAQLKKIMPGLMITFPGIQN